MVNRCCMCKGQLELLDHLLLHCQFARVPWDPAFSCLGICWVSSISITNRLLAWEGYFGRKVKKTKDLGFPCDFLGHLERRNQKVFEDDKTSLQRLKDNSARYLFSG